MAGDGAFQFGSEVHATLFEQVLVLPSEGPIDGRKMSTGGMEVQTKTAKTRAAVRRDFKLTCVPARRTVPHDSKVSSSRPEAHVRAQRSEPSGSRLGGSCRARLGGHYDARKPSDLDLPGYRLHLLKGGLKGYWSISISGNWRVIFRFEDGDAYDVDLIDYH